MVFADVPQWVATLAAVIAVVLTPFLVIATKAYQDWRAGKRADRIHDLQTDEKSAAVKARQERNALTQMQQLLQTSNEEHGRTIARFATEREDWSKEREEIRGRMEELRKEGNDCRERAAQQERDIEWLTRETNRQNEEIDKLKRRLGDLSQSIPGAPKGDSPK